MVATRSRVTLAVVVCLAAIGCSGPSGSGASGRLQIVATTTVFADLVRQVAGDRGDVRALVPLGGEPHTFDPRPSDVQAFSGADLVVLNGLGLDDWVVDLVGQAGSDAPLLRLGEDLPDVEYIGGDEEGGLNPHLWMDPDLASAYVARIAAELSKLDPDGAASYRERLTGYQAKLQELGSWADSQFDTNGRERRIVSFHDAFPYFARRFGLEVVGTVIEAPGQDPSAGEVAALIDLIRAEHVLAILTEVQFPPGLAERIADETGVPVIADLYTDSLGDPPVDTYEGLIRWDVEQISSALN